MPPNNSPDRGPRMPRMPTVDAPATPNAAELKAFVRTKGGMDADTSVTGLEFDTDAERNETKRNVMRGVSEHISQEDGRAALTAMASEFAHGATWEATAQSLVLTDTNAAGERKARARSNETDRLEIAQSQTVLYQDLLTYEYDHIPARVDLDAAGNPLLDVHGNPVILETAADRQLALRDQVKEIVLNHVLLRESLADEIAPGTYDVPDAVLENLLRSNEVRSTLSGSMDELFADSVRRDADARDTRFTTAKATYIESNGQFTQVATERRALQRERDTQQARQNEFTTDAAYDSTSTIVPPGATKEAVHTALTADADVIRFVGLRERARQLQARRDGGDASVTQAQIDIANMAARNPFRGNLKVEEFVVLDADRQDITTRLTSATTDLTAKDTQYTTLQAQAAAAKTELDNAVSAKEGVSKKFTEDIGKTMQRAVKGALIDQTKTFMRDYAQVKTKAADEMIQKLDNRITAAFQGRYAGLAEARVNWSPEYDWVQGTNGDLANADLESLSNVGPTPLTRQILIDAGIDRRDIALMEQDKRYWADLDRRTVNGAMAAVAESGGEIADPTLGRILQTDWGDDAITDLIYFRKSKLQKRADNVSVGLMRGTAREIWARSRRRGILLRAIGFGIRYPFVATGRWGSLQEEVRPTAAVQAQPQAA